MDLAITTTETIDSETYGAILNLRKEVFVVEQQVPLSIEVDEFESTSIHFLARADGVPVATGRIRSKGPRVTFERIATAAACRGRGYGRRLMAAMEAAAAERFPRHLPFMHSQESAVAFYERLRWVTIGERFEEADIPHFAMVKWPKSLGQRGSSDQL